MFYERKREMRRWEGAEEKKDQRSKSNLELFYTEI
jgi:hypothetical protein